MKINPIRFSGEIKPWCMYGWFEKIFQIELKGDFPSVDRMGFNTRTHSHPRVKYKYLFGMFGKFGIYQICGDGHWKWFGLWLPMHNLKVSIRVAGSRKLGGLARNLEISRPKMLRCCIPHQDYHMTFFCVQHTLRSYFGGPGCTRKKISIHI